MASAITDEDLFAVNPEDRIQSVHRKPMGPKVRMDLKTDSNQVEPLTPAPTLTPKSKIQTPSKHIDSAKYHSVALPSKFYFYPFQELMVRHFNVQDLLSIYEARTKESFRGLVDVISATMLNHSALELTFEDFWYMLYWHRINSYRKSKFQLEWTCDNPEHLKWVAEGKTDAEGNSVVVEESTLHNMEIISKSNLKVVDANIETIKKEWDLIEDEYDLQATPIYINEYVQFLEEQEERENALKKLEDGEEVPVMSDSDVMLSRYAMIVNCGSTLADRREFLRSVEDAELFMDLEAFLATLDYGVTEKFNVVCKECGASKEVVNSIDALSFLPHLQRAGFV